MSGLRFAILCGASLLAIVLQATLPLYFGFFTILDLPLLMVVYFALAFRGSAAGIIAGAVIGISKDTLSRDIIGVFGIANTVAGFVTSSMGDRMDTENPGIRAILVFTAFWLQLGCVYLIESLLLGQPVAVDAGRSAAAAVVNAVTGVLIFKVLDRFRSPV